MSAGGGGGGRGGGSDGPEVAGSSWEAEAEAAGDSASSSGTRLSSRRFEYM